MRNSYTKGRKGAFSLVEIMVAMIIISCIMAALAPVITKKLKSSNVTIAISEATARCSKFSSDCSLCYSNKCIICSKSCANDEYKDTNNCVCALCTTFSDKCLSCTDGGCTKCSVGYGLKDKGCEICPVGYYSNGTTSCLPCEVGKYQDECGKNSCKLCEVGKYQDEEGKGECKIPPDGTYQDLSGQSTTKICPTDYYCTNGIKTQCSAGKGANEGSSSCTLCSSSIANCAECSNLSQCTRCNSGYYLNSSGTCSICTAGYFCNGSVNQIQCASGQYADIGASSCSSCLSKWANCATCTSSECSSCSGNYILKDGNCITEPLSQADCNKIQGTFSLAFVSLGTDDSHAICVTTGNIWGDSRQTGWGIPDNLVPVEYNSDCNWNNGYCSFHMYSGYGYTSCTNCNDNDGIWVVSGNFGSQLCSTLKNNVGATFRLPNFDELTIMSNKYAKTLNLCTQSNGGYYNWCARGGKCNHPDTTNPDCVPWIVHGSNGFIYANGAQFPASVILYNSAPQSATWYKSIPGSIRCVVDIYK